MYVHVEKFVFFLNFFQNHAIVQVDMFLLLNYKLHIQCNGPSFSVLVEG
jgi:hypothetical protein